MKQHPGLSFLLFYTGRILFADVLEDFAGPGWMYSDAFFFVYFTEYLLFTLSCSLQV